MNAVGAEPPLIWVEMLYGGPQNRHFQPQLVMEDLGQTRVEPSPVASWRPVVWKAIYGVDHPGVIRYERIAETRQSKVCSHTGTEVIRLTAPRIGAGFQFRDGPDVWHNILLADGEAFARGPDGL